MQKAVWVLLLCIGISATSNAGVYKCTVDGKVKYQALPCDEGEQAAITVRTTTPTNTTRQSNSTLNPSAQQLLDQLTAERKAREAEREAERQRRQAIAIERDKARAAERQAQALEVQNELILRGYAR